MIFATFGVQIVVSSFDAPLVASIAARKDEKIARTSFLVMLAVNLFVLLALSSFFAREIAVFVWGDAGYFEYVRVLIIYIAILCLNHFFLINFQGEKNFRAYGSVQLLQQLLQLLAICIGVFANSVFILTVALIGVEIALWLALFFYSRDLLLASVHVTDIVRWISKSSKIAAPLIVAFLLIWVLNNGARLALVNFGGLARLAPFAATFSISVLAGVFINPICAFFFPYFSSVTGEERNNKDALITAQLVLAFLTTCASIAIILGAGKFLTYLVGGNLYAGDFFVFCVCAAQVAYAQARIVMLYLAVNGRPKQGVLYFFTGVLIMLVIDWSVTKEYGANGVAFAYFIGCSVIAVLFFRAAHAGNEKMTFLSDIGKVVVFLLIGMAVMMVCSLVSIQSWMQMLGATLFFLLLYFTSSYFNFSNESFVVQIKEKIVLFFGVRHV